MAASRGARDFFGEWRNNESDFGTLHWVIDDPPYKLGYKSSLSIAPSSGVAVTAAMEPRSRDSSDDDDVIQRWSGHSGPTRIAVKITKHGVMSIEGNFECFDASKPTKPSHGGIFSLQARIADAVLVEKDNARATETVVEGAACVLQ